jgi:hypothetical protein
MACHRRRGINHEPHWSCPEQGDSPRTHCGRIGEWSAKAQQDDRNEVGYALSSQPPRTIRELQQRTKDMNKLITTAAIIAALASAVPALAQRTGPGPTANTGTGPGVIPPGGFGPSSPLHNLNEGSAGLPVGVPSWAVQELAAPGPESSQVSRRQP